jgi:hypothetical protein
MRADARRLAAIAAPPPVSLSDTIAIRIDHLVFKP